MDKIVTIHRKQIEVGALFTAPKNITINYQKERKAISIWFKEEDSNDTMYIVVPTGKVFNIRIPDWVIPGDLRAAVIVDDFKAYHLIELKGERS